MNPPYIRITLASNKNMQLLAPIKQSILQHSGLHSSGQIEQINSNSAASISSGSSSALQVDEISGVPLCSLNINQQTLQQTCSSVSTRQETCKIFTMAETDSPAKNVVQCDTISDMDQKQIKRGKNWSEEETATFISIWSDNYESLMTGGSRNTPIYNTMAHQINQLFSQRVMTGADVKAKITNLIAEYRKKKKEHGKTGSSPSSWRYFDQIDKLLGERPFNDDTLISDSIIFQQEQLLQDIENASATDFNFDSLTEDADNNISNLIKEIEESTTNSDNRSCSSINPCNSTPIQKVTTLKLVLDSLIILYHLNEDTIEIDWNIQEPIYKKPACGIQTTGAAAVREALTQYFIQNPI
ncbi:unnamed protein product [Rotaria sp. Silwood2]|nr:unnamed protein product [Rotaria sp. Silwood2]